jgi:hypothetical protein
VEAAPTVPAERTIWVTSVTGEADHAVTDEDMAAALTDDSGLYRTLCGATIIAAPLVCPPCPRCTRCRDILRARAMLREPTLRVTGRHRRPGVLSRLLRRNRAGCTRD